MAHLSGDAVQNESEIVPNGKDRRTVSNGFIDCGKEASTRILTLREEDVGEDITYWHTVAQLIIV